MRTILAHSSSVSSVDGLFVAPSGGDLTRIGDAPNASGGKEWILVAPGIYPGFDTLDRSVTIIATGGLVEVTEQVLIRDLQATESVFLSGLRVLPALLGVNADLDSARGLSLYPWGFGSPNPPGGALANAGFSVGQTRHFQVFYRDNFQTGCQTALNTSNGVSVTVQL